MRSTHKHSGFTLPAVLVVVAALLILAVGILLVVGIERDTARSFVDRQRAELAARAGLEELRGILAREAANDDFIVIQSTIAETNTSGKTRAPHLFIARGKPDSEPFEFRYIPLFSVRNRPEDAPLQAPELEPLTGEDDQSINFSTLPYLDSARVAWIPVRDEKERVVARYAYWVEDLQSRVDPAIAGNDKGKDKTHARAKWPFPAPGLNNGAEGEPALDQIATFALDPDAMDTAQGDLGKTLFKNRKLLISPDSLLAAAGIQPPLERLATGALADEKYRDVEKGLMSGIQSYQEQPLVPFSEGIDPSTVGKPKLNLNKLLSTGGDEAVNEMADFIKQALPEFEERKGGFPDDYLKTLAANVLDYADADNDATVKTGEYRGIDAYPLVSEFLFKSRIESVRVAAGRKHINLSVTVYVELWNMTNQPVEGSAEITYETKYGFVLPPDPNPFQLDDLSKAVHNLTEDGGYRWFPKFNVELQPDEYRVFKCGTVSYSFDAAVETEDIDTTLVLDGEISAPSGAGYRMRWNGELVDQSRGGLRRNSSRLQYLTDPEKFDTKKHPREQVRCNIPGHSCRIGADAFQNMGDARMAFYILAPQDANAYPQNYSPNRRNIRLDIYTDDQNRVIGRVLPSEWPDGGHDSPFGTDSLHGLLGMELLEFDGDQRINPDDPRFLSQPPDLSLGKEEAPTRLSNNGRFYSVTELGRIFDPVMWQARADTNTRNSPGQSWGDVLSTTPLSPNQGGGNTLRTGRSEHPKFNVPGQRASHLLDLFHTGISRSADETKREGAVVRIHGHVNLNTATQPALRQMIAGSLGQDPELRSFIDDSHEGDASKFPKVIKTDPVPDATAIADRIASAIIASRPFASTGELANVREFGDKRLFPEFSGSGYPMIQWTDSAAEELFARTHEASTVRSRNFRIWVIGQSLVPSASASDTPKVLSEVRKAYTVFADPGERNPDGSPDPAKFRLKALHENDF